MKESKDGLALADGQMKVEERAKWPSLQEPKQAYSGDLQADPEDYFDKSLDLGLV